MTQQKITPHLWFDDQVREAVDFYVGMFPESKMIDEVVLHDTPPGDTQVVSFELSGMEFMAINGGPEFRFNPSTSFMLNFDPSRDSEALKHLNETWEQLAEGGRC